jgi:phosphate-selective porin
VTSWSTWASFFLTGESKRVNNFGWRQPKPKNDFDPVNMKGLGALEALLRYTRTNTNDSLFRTATYAGDTYRILKGADRVDEFTVGMSWTWNAMIRWQFNYVHLSGDGIQSGDKSSAKDTGDVSSEDLLGFRLMFKF